MKGSRAQHQGRVVQFGPLTFVYYEHAEFPEAISAHCLELNIGAHGASKEEAAKDLKDAIEEYVLHHVDEGEALAVRPAPEEFWAEEDREQFHLLLLVMEEAERKVVFSEPPPQQFGAPVLTM